MARPQNTEEADLAYKKREALRARRAMSAHRESVRRVKLYLKMKATGQDMSELVGTVTVKAWEEGEALYLAEKAERESEPSVAIVVGEDAAEPEGEWITE